MKRIDLKRKDVLLFLLLALATLLPLTLLGYAYYRADVESARELIRAEERANLEFRAASVRSDFHQLLSMLRFLADQVRLHRALSDPEGRRVAAEDFLSFMRTTDLLDRIRVLDLSGREVAVADRVGGIPALAPDSELRTRGDSPYFEAAVELGAGGIYCSPIESAAEGGRGVSPGRPVVHFATPVFDASGVRRGVVAIDFDAERMLAHVSPSGRGSVSLHGAAGRALGVAARGGERAPELPESVRSRMREHRAGQLFHRGDLYTFATVDPGEGEADVNHAPVWRLVSVTPAAVLDAAPRQTRRRLLVWSTLLAAVLLAGIAAIVALRRRRLSLEAELWRSRESLANAQRIARLGNWDWDIVDNTLHWSDEIYRIFGLAPQQFAATYEAFLESVHPDDRDLVRRAVGEALEGRREYAIDHRIVRPDGEERIVHEQAEVVRDENGEPMAMHGTVQDVTGQRRNERQLRTLSQAVEQGGEAVIIADRTGTVEYVNSAFERMSGHSAAEVRGRRLPSIEVEGEREGRLWTSVREGRHWRGRLVARHRSGCDSPVLASVAPITDEHGLPVRSVIVLQDLSEVEKLEEQVRRSQKMEAIGTLVGGIAHDFNNMLAGINGSAQLAREEFGGTPRLDEMLDRIERLGERGADLIRQLLTFARKEHVEMRPLSLTDLIRGEAARYAEALPDRIDFRVDAPKDPLTLCGDALQLTQVLRNLLNNARDAVEEVETPRIEVSLSRVEPDAGLRAARPELAGVDACALLRVRDSGRGVPEEHLDKVFDPFFTTKAVDRGTGLGLAMVYGAARMHDGAVELESRVGAGTEVRLYLPLLPEECGNAGSDRVVGGKGELVLLADDDDEVRHVSRRMLERFGYEVLEAKDGAQALELFERNREAVALAVLDVVMPKLGGVEAARRMRAANPGLPLLFVTGYDRDEAGDARAELGRCVLVTKPFTAGSLGARIGELLGG